VDIVATMDAGTVRGKKKMKNHTKRLRKIAREMIK
jgi:hypothetical protein